MWLTQSPKYSLQLLLCNLICCHHIKKQTNNLLFPQELSSFKLTIFLVLGLVLKVPDNCFLSNCCHDQQFTALRRKRKKRNLYLPEVLHHAEPEIDLRSKHLMSLFPMHDSIFNVDWRVKNHDVQRYGWREFWKYSSRCWTHLIRGAGARLANRFLKLSTRPALLVQIHS